MAGSWIDSALSVGIKCSNTKHRETNTEYNNVNKVEISDSILENELDLEELCELNYVAVCLHVQEVMNELIMKLTQEVEVLKTNSEKLINDLNGLK